MANRIERNVKRTQVWGRVFLSGASGSGKTRAAFELASRLFDGTLPIVYVNTEPNRGTMYADRFPIDTLIDLEGDYHPDRFIEAIESAEEVAPGGVLIIDSATHEWYGTNGVTQLASRFGDWAKIRPLHQKFVDRMQVAQMHIIVCCRAKMKYEQVEIEDGRGGKKPSVVALGVGPMQDADFQYEFSLAGQIDRISHEIEWSGHIDSLEGTTSNLVENADAIAKTLTGWLSEGEPIEAPAKAEEKDVDALLTSLREERELGNARLTDDVIEETFAKARAGNRGVLSPEYVAEQTAKSADRVAVLKRKAAAAGSEEQETLEEAGAKA